MNFFEGFEEKYEKVIDKLLESSNEQILSENYSAALYDLKNCEAIIDHKSSNINFYLVLGVYHNSSLCYQRLQNDQQALNYITTTINKAKQIFLLKDKNYGDMQVFKYSILRMLQMSAVLSHCNNHTQALDNAKKTLKYLNKLFMHLSSLVVKKLKELKIRKKEKKPENIEKLEFVSKILDKIILNKFEKSALIQGQEWINTYNMGSIMIIQPFLLSE